MRYAIDGSNVLLGLRLNKKPSTRLLARLLFALREHGDTFQLFFDNSVAKIMETEGLATEWSAFRDALSRAEIIATFAARVDPLIAQLCSNPGTAVINCTDKMDSWNLRPTRIHRVGAYYKSKTVQLVVIDDATSTQILSIQAHEPFQFGGIRFPLLNVDETVLDQLIAPDTEYGEKRRPTDGVLLVLALDASESMSERDSFDRRPKSEHLNEVVRTAIARLRNSAIARGLYIAILRFENDVTPLFCPTTGTPFASVNDWFKTLTSFNYLQGVTMSQTNLRLALQRAKELIQNTLADKECIESIAPGDWHASVVLITDGNHVVTRPDGTMETDADVGAQALDIHSGLSGLASRIDVGCVGIGTDVNRSLLSAIASQCTPTQLRMAANAGLSAFLEDNRLFICVNSNDRKFGEAIRNLINVASSRAA